MIRSTTIALIAALVAGSTAAHADAMNNDANTGLENRYYYDTLQNLDREGLPISTNARAYLKQHGGGSHAAASRRGNVYLLEDRPAYGAHYDYAAPQDRIHLQ